MFPDEPSKIRTSVRFHLETLERLLEKGDIDKNELLEITQKLRDAYDSYDRWYGRQPIKHLT